MFCAAIQAHKESRAAAAKLEQAAERTREKRGAGQAMNKTSVGLGSSAGRGPCRKEEALQAFHAWLQGAVRKVEAGFKFSFAF